MAGKAPEEESDPERVMKDAEDSFRDD